MCSTLIVLAGTSTKTHVWVSGSLARSDSVWPVFQANVWRQVLLS